MTKITDVFKKWPKGLPKPRVPTLPTVKVKALKK